jgi:hypothetical protein
MAGGLSEEKAAEKVRNLEGGTYPGRQSGVKWTR